MIASIRIVLTGPESCAKSTVAIRLSSSRKGTLLTEHSRDYLQPLGGVYEPQDILEMAQQHAKLMDELPGAGQVSILDTDLLTYCIWYEDKFGTAPPSLWDLWHQRMAHFYLLCFPDTPWIADPLRENPYDRHRLFQKYLRVLNSTHVNYNILTGMGAERFKRAEFFVMQFLKNQFNFNADIGVPHKHIAG
ncbi:MAG: ATP-binding protein [Saprospiraceae bacterium]|nr:ATP-binding protein [Saprospiraceae bacterium]